MHSQRVVVVCVAAAGMLATFLPWASLGPISVAGTAGDGWITLALFAGALLTAVLGRRSEPMQWGSRLGIAVLALAAAGVGLHDLSAIRSNVEANLVGAGLYLVGAAGLLLFLVASFGGHWWQPATAVVCLVGVAVAGIIHVVYGDATGFAICKKAHWSLADTFVDGADYRDRTLRSVIEEHHGPALYDLVECGLLKTRVPETKNAARCAIDGSPGVCMEAGVCNGLSRSGLCPGDAYTQCCIPMVRVED